MYVHITHIFNSLVNFYWKIYYTMLLLTELFITKRKWGRKMKRIVLAFDGSAHAINAVNEAKKLMKGFPGVSLTILEVLDIAKAKDQALDLSKNYEERKNVRINEVKQQLVGILDTFEISILIGDPASEIIQHVKQNDYDLLIMGSRGLNLLQEFVLGSVSHKVMKYVSIPVLIVK